MSWIIGLSGVLLGRSEDKFALGTVVVKSVRRLGKQWQVAASDMCVVLVIRVIDGLRFLLSSARSVSSNALCACVPR